MDLSRVHSRRTIVALALAGIAARVAPVRAAQTTAGCDIGFTNGLLTIGGEDCELLSPPGLDGANIGLPGHMVSGTGTASTSGTATSAQETSSLTSTSTSSTTSPQAERQARLQKRRNKHRTHKGRKRDQRKTQAGRKQTRKQSRIEALITCEDFSSQKEAIEWMNQYSEDRATLDPDGDLIACEELSAVRCSQFTSQAEVKSWHKLMGFQETDPFGLKGNGDNADAYCPKLPETTEG